MSTQIDEITEHLKNVSGAKNQASSVVINIIATFLTSSSLGMLAILIPVQLSSLEYTDPLIGAVLSFETIAALVVCFFIPSFLKLMGLKAGMLVSTLLRVPTILIFPFFSAPEVIASAIFIHAVGCYMMFLLLQIWINTLNFDKNRGLMVALYSTSVSIGLAVGPVIVNLCSQYIVLLDSFFYPLLTIFNVLFNREALVDNTSVYIVSAILSASSLLPLLMYLPNLPRLSFSGGASIIRMIQNNKGAMFSISMAGVSQFGVAAFITIYGMKNGLSISDSALLLTSFMFGSLLLEIPIAWLSDKFDRRYVIVWCSFLSMFCGAYLPIAIETPREAWALVFIWGGVIAGIYSVSLAVIGEKYLHNDEMIASNAAYSLMESIGGTLGIISIGLAMYFLGMDGMPYVIMFASILYFSFALTRYPVK